MTANNFDEFVIPMADEAPHAVILDWYRRLELMIRDYLTARQLLYQNGPCAERVIAQDAFLGAGVANEIKQLRWFRNEIAHGSQALTSAQAVAFARDSLDLIGRLWRAEDAYACVTANEYKGR
jgi:hypothetical protein